MHQFRAATADTRLLEATKARVCAPNNAVINIFDPDAIRIQVAKDFHDHRAGARLGPEDVIAHLRPAIRSCQARPSHDRVGAVRVAYTPGMAQGLGCGRKRRGWERKPQRLRQQRALSSACNVSQPDLPMSLAPLRDKATKTGGTALSGWRRFAAGDTKPQALKGCGRIF